MIITYDEPGITYDDHRVTYDGVFTDASVWPAESTVSLGVQYGPNGVDFTGSAIAGNGAQIIAYRSDVQIKTPTLRIASRPKKSQKTNQDQGLQTIRPREQSKYLYSMTSVRRSDVFTEQNEVFVTTTTEAVSI